LTSSVAKFSQQDIKHHMVIVWAKQEGASTIAVLLLLCRKQNPTCNSATDNCLAETAWDERRRMRSPRTSHRKHWGTESSPGNMWELIETSHVDLSHASVWQKSRAESMQNLQKSLQVCGFIMLRVAVIEPFICTAFHRALACGLVANCWMHAST